MYCYMINIYPLGEYYRAFEHSLKSFRSKDPAIMAQMSDAVYKADEQTFYISSLGQEMKITYPEGQVTFVDKDLQPLWEWQLVILNHISRAGGQSLTGDLISYRELEAGSVYYEAFKKNSINQIITKLSQESLGKIAAAAEDLGGQVKIGDGKITATFQFLPRVPVTLHFWSADDELPASANILFDSTANDYLHTEDFAAVGSLLTDFLCEQIMITE